MKDRVRPLAIQQYIKLAQQPNVISFAAGLPDLSVLPLKQLKNAYAQTVLDNDSLFQYRPPVDELKQKIQSLMHQRSVPCSLDEMLITGGAQQGIALTASLWFEQQHHLMVEDFVYPGFLHVANYYDLNMISIPSLFNQGMNLQALEQVLKTKKTIPYLYVVCNGNNPQGYTWSAEQRQSLAKLADQYNFIIIEDDPYCYLTYSDEAFLPLRAYTKNAIYISSFSKIIAPTVRVGWMVGDAELIKKFEHLKDMDDLYLSNPNQLAVNRFLEQQNLDEIVTPQINLYQSKMNCMLTSLKLFLEVPYHIVIPKHGMFIWLEFPDISIEEHQQWLFETSKVLFIPGSAFSTSATTRKQAMRLCFTSATQEQIIEGIKRLANALNRLHQTSHKLHFGIDIPISRMEERHVASI